MKYVLPALREHGRQLAAVACTADEPLPALLPCDACNGALLAPQLGAFGGDNRAGIDRTLHRISCLRNRDGRVIGLTCRAGRAVCGSAALAADLVAAGRSLLLLVRAPPQAARGPAGGGGREDARPAARSGAELAFCRPLPLRPACAGGAFARNKRHAAGSRLRLAQRMSRGPCTGACGAEGAARR